MTPYLRDLTWPGQFFFYQKLCKGCPISYAKFQHDPPHSSGLGVHRRKISGGGIHPPLPGRGLTSKESQSFKTAVFTKTVDNYFWLKKATKFLLPPSCPYCQGSPNKLCFALIKRSRPWPDRKGSCCTSVDLHGRPEHMYIGYSPACLSNVSSEKNCSEPFMTWNDLGGMRRGRNYTWFHAYCYS